MNRFRPLVHLFVLSIVVVLTGCGSAAKLSTGRGIHWTWSDQQLATEGYPGHRDEYSGQGWGVLFDDEGVPYGPKSFYEGRERLDHPYLTVTDDYLESRWIRIYRSECCTEPLLGHFLEILDLAYVDVTGHLGYTPPMKLSVNSPGNVDDYRRQTGLEFWVTHVVSGPSIVLEPIDILFRRTLAGHAAYAAVTQSVLDLQTHGRIPMWLREGLSSYLAQEGYEHLSFMGEFRTRRSILMTPAEVEQHVYPLLERENGRIARYNAFLMVWQLSEAYGWGRVQQLLHAVQDGAAFEDAVERVYGIDPAQWLALLDPTVNGEPTTAIPPRPGH